MSPSSPSKFIRQDLKGKSLRGQRLRGASFLECDLRGCDFSRTDLTAARFVRCRTGFYPQKGCLLGIPVLLAIALMFHAISSLVFATMGTLPGQAAWPYVLALHTALAIATVSTGLQTLSFFWAKVAAPPAHASTAALAGFFYGGRLADNDPTVAVAGAVFLGMVGLLAAWRRAFGLIQALFAMMGAIAAYGLAFLVWTNGSNLLTTGSWGRGSLLAATSLACIGVSLRSAVYGWQQLRRAATTSFREADLTDCAFVETPMPHN
ncbi:pentapeptide repeat-containing protein [Oscillatoria sp. CS-180]|uniref:pentapeptide repeat-containing protein n=1 Tax=Oscillatoria sp. CS-180 TaxID=3021720 RepID=UPI00232C9114|nr:pentapeptide repeat-containing protein [Oscillatoria sp. CS-180]MDB9526409.1 pentapeptide repeat-containing protein [Oscillatoria sp. CS-180]